MLLSLVPSHVALCRACLEGLDETVLHATHGTAGADACVTRRRIANRRGRLAMAARTAPTPSTVPAHRGRDEHRLAGGQCLDRDTPRGHRREAEQLMRWAIVAKGRPRSSFDTLGLAEYLEQFPGKRTFTGVLYSPA
ncbi:hypothetical protein [Burkholderia glumae]|uniref:hypothetical protein n=1 Tax=Burkholderia glumae TaxID=337 RepID=UPI0004750664|nr:hypothetical protein [Burkholderia glumae]MCM2547129.1 hypothetical protein [Burkholderia glumae]